MANSDYSKADIIKALIDAGISPGDNLFIHSNIGFFGRLEGAVSKDDYFQGFKSAIFEIIGETGTLVVPVFSYSYCRGEIFDPTSTKSTCGMLSESVREDPEALRSHDANFSIAAIGRNAKYFTEVAPEHSFGSGTFWERFVKSDGKFCNFNFDSGSTFIHYVEKLLNVPYRYDKGFKGVSIIEGKEKQGIYYHFVYDLDKPGNGPDFTKFDKAAKEKGLTKAANLGKGQVLSITSKDVVSLIKEEIKRNGAFLTKGSVVG